MEDGFKEATVYFLNSLQQKVSLDGVPSTILWLIFASLLFFYWFGIRPYSVLKSGGIPHPSVKPFLGNVIEYVKKGSVEFHQKYMSKFGGVYGFYIGRRPVVAVSDPKILEKVLVKDFQQFHNRPTFLGTDRKPMDKGLLICDYPIWKKVRPVVSPTFSSGKIKQMLQFVEKSVDTYVQILADTSKNDEVVDVFGSFGRLTMEVIMSVAFGMENDFQLRGSETMIQRACRWFQISPIVFLVDILPLPHFVRSWIKQRTTADPTFFVDLLRPIVEERKMKPSERTDFLQLLLSENKKDGKPKLDDDEIFASSVSFLLAGYETTSNALAYTLYLLALHQDVQQRLYDEIKENFNEDGELYDEIQKLAYLDSVLNESLRIYPPAYQTARLIQNEYEIESFKFPKGIALQIPIYFIHHNEQFWEDPEKFDPLRFGGERKSKINPYHFLPFGYGPRNCVGARFASVEAKLAIIKVVKRFKIEPSGETEIPLKLRFGITMSPKNGIKLCIKERL